MATAKPEVMNFSLHEYSQKKSREIAAKSGRDFLSWKAYSQDLY